MKIAVSAETTVDLSKELLEKYDIHTVPFTVVLGKSEYADGEVSSKEIIEYVRKNKVLPKTSAVNKAQFDEYFKNLLKDYDAVIHFSLSSEMSSAFNNAVESAKGFKNVVVIDSRTLSTAIALPAIYASNLIKENKFSFSEIVEKVKLRVPSAKASFVLNRLDFLHKGGRCSSLALFGANLLRIKPQILVENGKMGVGKKYRGNFINVVKNYCEDTLNKYDNPDLSVGFVTHTECDDEIIKTAEKIMIDRGFKNVYVTEAGGTITSHCGENCIGILFLNDGNEH